MQPRDVILATSSGATRRSPASLLIGDGWMASCRAAYQPTASGSRYQEGVQSVSIRVTPHLQPTHVGAGVRELGHLVWNYLRGTGKWQLPNVAPICVR